MYVVLFLARLNKFKEGSTNYNSWITSFSLSKEVSYIRHILGENPFLMWPWFDKRAKLHLRSTEKISAWEYEKQQPYD